MSAQKYALVVSEFNQDITHELKNGAVTYLKSQDIAEDDIKIITVPGAIEIPYAAKLLAREKKFAAIICLGCVIRGDTDHYDYVCQQVSYGCQKVMLETMVPIIFGVITTNNEQQAFDRVGGKEGHKGIDAAKTAIMMANLSESL